VDTLRRNRAGCGGRFRATRDTPAVNVVSIVAAFSRDTLPPNVREQCDHLHSYKFPLLVTKDDKQQPWRTAYKRRIRTCSARWNPLIWRHCLFTTVVAVYQNLLSSSLRCIHVKINLLKPTGHVMHRQFNIQQLYALPTLYLCVLYLSENKQRLVPLTA